MKSILNFENSDFGNVWAEHRWSVGSPTLPLGGVEIVSLSARTTVTRETKTYGARRCQNQNLQNSKIDMKWVEPRNRLESVQNGI